MTEECDELVDKKACFAIILLYKFDCDQRGFVYLR